MWYSQIHQIEFSAYFPAFLLVQLLFVLNQPVLRLGKISRIFLDMLEDSLLSQNRSRDINCYEIGILFITVIEDYSTSWPISQFWFIVKRYCSFTRRFTVLIRSKGSWKLSEVFKIQNVLNKICWSSIERGILVLYLCSDMHSWGWAVQDPSSVVKI